MSKRGEKEFVIRDLPEMVWANFITRAASEGWQRGDLIKRLIADYANGLVTPSTDRVDAA